MECVQIDLNNVCRTCKDESPEMKALYYRDSESGKETIHLDEMLMACASVQVSNDDGLPKSICPSCFVQLKNAYSFKVQCEKTDLFLRDYFKNLKKISIKEEVVTDLEFTSNFISSPLKDVGEIKDDKRTENIKEDPESSSGESPVKDVDYVQVVDSNLTIYECRTCSKIFYTLEDLKYHKEVHTDNIEEHYMKMYFENNTTTFSDQWEGGGGDNLVVAEETMKREVELSENNDQKKINEKARITNEIYVEEDSLQMLMKTKIEEEIYKEVDDGEVKEEEPEVNNSNAYGSDASTHSEYLPTKTKRGHKRSRKHPISFKPTDKSRGRPPLLKLKAKSPENEIDKFPCSQCEEVFAKASLLKKHAKQHAGLRIHECETCSKKFRRRDHLQAHKISHMDVKAFVCMICGKCFKRKRNLQRHMNLHLNNHSCDLCQADFSRPQELAKHKASMHNICEKITREKKYKCQYCQKGFTTEKYRNFHIKTHMKFHNDSYKKFLCSECGERFIRNDYLVIHMRRHRGEKPFKCKFCEKGFIRTTDLTEHEICHTGEKTHFCVICGKGFGRAYSLRVHMRTHTGEKPYRCTYCDAAFTQGNDLKTHVRKHTGERFQCELCPKAYLIRNVLTQHKRIVHGMNIVSSKRRLQLINKLSADDPQPITVNDPLELHQNEVSDLKQEREGDLM